METRAWTSPIRVWWDDRLDIGGFAAVVEVGDPVFHGSTEPCLDLLVGQELRCFLVRKHHAVDMRRQIGAMTFCRLCHPLTNIGREAVQPLPPFAGEIVGGELSGEHCGYLTGTNGHFPIAPFTKPSCRGVGELSGPTMRLQKAG